MMSSTGMNEGSPVLEVRELHAGYGDIKAVWGISMHALPGRVSLLLGRNGAGKTTTLRAISGLTSPLEGQVILNGRDITKLPAHSRAALGIAFVQEGKRVFVDRTVEENLLLGTYSKRWSKARRKRACEQAYERFPILASRRRQRAGSLSGGQQQMLAIGAALISGPSVLLLDEPSAGLAPAIIDEVLTVVKNLCTEGMAVVLVEQNAEKALTIADSVLVLELGRVTVDVNAADADVSKLVRAAYFDVG
jgi:branched-chain amino acid transport system ATP-binding protein